MNSLKHSMQRRLMVAMSLMLLCACSSDDELPQPNAEVADAITFSCGLQETEQVSTRATTPLHDAGIGSFRVWAYKNTAFSGNAFTNYQTVINDYRVWWEPTLSLTNENNWEYVNGTTQGVKYWDNSANAYRFMAIAPATATYTASITGDDAKHLHIALHVDATDAAAPYYSRLWFSTGSPIDFPDKQFHATVQMQFVKPVAYVRFMFTYEDPAEAATTTLTGKNFEPTNGGLIEQMGNVLIDYPITGTGTAETISVSPDGVQGITAFTQDYYLTPADENACTTYAVLPATRQGTYTLRVNVNGEPKSVVVPEAYMDWLPSHEYTYIFKVRADGGVSIDSVQSAFTPWETENGVHSVYNW